MAQTAVADDPEDNENPGSFTFVDSTLNEVVRLRQEHPGWVVFAAYGGVVAYDPDVKEMEA